MLNTHYHTGCYGLRNYFAIQTLPNRNLKFRYFSNLKYQAAKSPWNKKYFLDTKLEGSIAQRVESLNLEHKSEVGMLERNSTCNIGMEHSSQAVVHSQNMERSSL